MVTRSLFTGVSGLQSHFDKMDTLSNNISNLNTPGFKKSNVVFKSFISQQSAAATAPSATRGGTNPQSVGLGVTTGSVNLDMGQGQLQRTGVNTDLALQGEGFFTARQAGSNQNVYTRAGSFQFDSDGNLVDPANGNVVQGYNAEVENGQIQDLVSQGTPEDVQVTTAMESIPGQATTFQELDGNLDASAEVGIDPIEVGFDNSEVRFEFQRYHPEENMYRFNAVWTQNPPSGKQVGDTVIDQVTGRELQGVMKINDSGQVEGVFQNPDTNFTNGVEQIEAPESNSVNYTINRENLTVRDQEGLFADLKTQDWNGEMRLQFTNNTGQYNVQWQDVTGNWSDVIVDGTGPTSFTGNIGADTRLQRDIDADGNVEREGELTVNSDFINGTTSATGDVIYFTPKGAVSNDLNNGMLNRKAQEVTTEDGTLKSEFNWGGDNGSFRVKSPESITGAGSLNRVFNYDETNLGAINENFNLSASPSGTGTMDEIRNKEFLINGTGAGTYEVYADVNADDDIDPTASSQDFLAPAMGTDVTVAANRQFTSGADQQLYADTDGDNITDTEVGVEIAANDWDTAPDAATEIKFAVTQARAPASDDRAFGVVSDGDGNQSALFMPQDDPDSGMNFAPNINDTSPVMAGSDPNFTTLVANSGSGATAQQKNDSQIQTVASSDVFDSQGNQHTLNYTFEKQDTNEWIYKALDPAPVDPDQPEMAGFGKIRFDENGQVQQVTSFNSQVPQQYPPQGPDGDVESNAVYFNPPENQLQNDSNLDVGASPVSLNPNFNNVSQFAGENNVEVSNQDGNAQGQLTSLSFDQTGTLQGSYDNGELRELAQVSVATFQNPEGLEKEGGTYFSESANSGVPQAGTAGNGGRGAITPGALERSNVELSAQFTQVISTQRGFQANTRTITTTDQMVQSVLQLV